MRDLKADVELCNKATPGPWKFHEVEFQCGRDECPYEKKREDNSCLKCDGVEIYQSAFVPEVLTLGCGEYDGMNDADAEFIAQSREGWLHAIERAIKAETLVLELREALNKIAYPVRYLQNEADKKNLSLDGRVATELANSSHWLKSIAKEVLGDEA